MQTTYGPGDKATWGPCMGHPLDPRTDDDGSDDLLSADEADELAADQIDRCSYSLAWWINEVTPADPQVEDVAAAGAALDAGDEDGLSCGALLALAFNDAGRAVQALAVLRDRYRQYPATVDSVGIRASELQAEANKPARLPAPLPVFRSPSAGSRRSFPSMADVQAYERGRAAHACRQPRPDGPSPAWQGWQDAHCEARAAHVEGMAA